MDSRWRDRRLRAWPAYGWVLLVYAVGWGLGMVFAAAYVTGDYVPAATQGWLEAASSVGHDLTRAGLALGLVALVCVRYGVSARQVGLARPRSLRDWQLEAWGALLLICVVGAVFYLVPGQGDRAPDDSYRGAPDLVTGLVSSVLAGPMEEICLLGLLVVLLSRAGRPPWEVLVVAVGLRWSFHVYYAGPGASAGDVVQTLALAVWPVLVTLWFFRFRRLGGLVVAHSVHNVAADLSALGLVGELCGDLLEGGLLVAATVVVLVAYTRASSAGPSSGHLPWRQRWALVPQQLFGVPFRSPAPS